MCDVSEQPQSIKLFVNMEVSLIKVSDLLHKVMLQWLVVRSSSHSLIFLCVVIAGAIFCYVTRRSKIQKEETLIDPYNDIRETIYNYDEEGMPEEDQDGYDISRLSKPLHNAIQPEVEKPLSRAAPST